MKKRTYTPMNQLSLFSFLIVILLIVTITVSGNTNKEETSTWPEDVNRIIEKSCFGCHNTNTKNDDGREALDFQKINELSLIKKISTYSEIGKTIEKNEMPTKSFLDKYPEKALSEKEKKLLIDWSKKEAEKLVKSKY